METTKVKVAVSLEDIEKIKKRIEACLYPRVVYKNDLNKMREEVEIIRASNLLSISLIIANWLKPNHS